MNFTHSFDILPYQALRFPQARAVSSRRDGAWRAWSTEELIDASDRLAAGLLLRPWRRGDRVGVWVDAGSAEWVIADRALQLVGLIPVPLHATAREEELRFIAENAYLVACFVSNENLWRRWRDLFPDMSDVYTLQPVAGATHWASLCAEPGAALGERRAGIAETDAAILLYTSGATGMPKGVLLSHRNVVSNVKSVLAFTPVEPGETVVSFLPLSHVFERSAVYLYLAAGVELWFLEDITRLAEDMRAIHPHFFTTVPRILERMYERAVALKQEAGPWRRRVMGWALNLAAQYPFHMGEQRLRLLYRLQLALARLLVFNRLRRLLGGRVHGIASGAAALSLHIARFFAAAGIPVREGYGLTETSPVVAFNRFEPGGTRLGTVGMPVPGVEVRIEAPDETGEGEIVVRGPNVMLGYWNAPEDTAAVISADGWFRTGDVGCWEKGRFLRITGRRSELFKTSSGKFIAPAFVEAQLMRSPFIAQAMALGHNEAHVGALVAPDFAQLERWCRKNNVHWTAPVYMVHNLRVQQFLQAEIERINEKHLSPPERVRVHALVAEPWTPENGLLTATLKLRRGVILRQYAREIAEMFG
ncbi:MAG: long-chain fatty acid--CoA ligase [Saprospiraceae bacterium]|nr:long-chain fatty acid--CoA ligase [Saprospiraceae bacterium]